MALLTAFSALVLILAAPSDGGQVPVAWAPASGAGDLTNHMSRPPKGPRLVVRIPDAAPAVPLPTIEGPKDPRRPLVVIDAGHGGHDPGAYNASLDIREKDLTLAIAQAVRDELLKTGRIRVALTRSDDRFLILQERYSIASKLGAGLFISIHADAAQDGEARGATVYTLSDVASDREAARLAARENRTDIINGVDLSGASTAVSSILIDLTRRDTMESSARFAEILHREGLPHFRFRTPYHRQASLVVLKSADTPSVLLETGYVSNNAEAGWMATRDGRLQLAKGVAAAVSVYFARQSVQR
ncbi:N-acetylmuramoyl-L-alanine amidase [Sphingobium sp. B7D2B]|uniref:N-acetylmuramoyl-L-alanine amidase family protein n=1 Tax=Sphingobium sp. B7D2B TaxID=2940583 RepID=UPI0029CAB477|nr:N-acetylmuramoyl-L-alanine amidase [Sphingobium sp. B7D2B]MCW2364967.1 N-acetylmuramoyl-L-alanine amidase [Sphingobium sp. B7D2B]